MYKYWYLFFCKEMEIENKVFLLYELVKMKKGREIE